MTSKAHTLENALVWTGPKGVYVNRGNGFSALNDKEMKTKTKASTKCMYRHHLCKLSIPTVLLNLEPIFTRILSSISDTLKFLLSFLKHNHKEMITKWEQSRNRDKKRD